MGDKGGIYRIVEASAVATKVSQLTVPLEGSSFGVDFNPAANALRVVSETGQNLRHPFATFTGAFFPINTSTSLFDLDTVANQIVLQSPANSRLLAATGKLRQDQI